MLKIGCLLMMVCKLESCILVMNCIQETEHTSVVEYKLDAHLLV